MVRERREEATPTQHRPAHPKGLAERSEAILIKGQVSGSDDDGGGGGGGGKPFWRETIQYIIILCIINYIQNDQGTGIRAVSDPI